MSERQKLQEEIAYYTALIESHKRRFGQQSGQVTANPAQRQGASNAPKHGSIVVPRSGSSLHSVASDKRTVVKPQSSSRVVIFANKADPRSTTEKGDAQTRHRTVLLTKQPQVAKPSGANKFVWVNKNLLQSSSETQQKLEAPGVVAKKPNTALANQKACTQKDVMGAAGCPTKPTSSLTLTENVPSKRVSSSIQGSASPITTKATNKCPAKPVSKPFNPVQAARASGQVNSSDVPASSQYVVRSKYQLVKKVPASSVPDAKEKEVTGAGLVKSQKTPSRKVSRYKIVRNASARKSPHRRDSPYLSKSGKRLISKYKIRRRSQELKRLPAGYGASPILHMSKGQARVTQYKLDRRVRASPFKLVRRSPGHPLVSTPLTTPASRSRYKWRSSRLSRKSFVSPYKLVRQRSVPVSSKQDALKTQVVRQIASRALQRSAVVSLKAKYKKNNTNEKHCLFYMRFGKCNRGDKCFYIHDPERVAVCTRYLRGTCNIDNCPFSHDAKKEKVPVCRHFLRGVCIRDGCPYLHVNVGKDAPICKNFAMHRYCHLGEKCKSLHTDICPDRDESGSCPKGKHCQLRHPKKMSNPKSRHKPADHPRVQAAEVQSTISDRDIGSAEEDNTSAWPSYISLSDSVDQTSESPGGLPVLLRAGELKTKPHFLK